MEISELRNQMNFLDDQLVELFEKRMKTALEIADYKKKHGLAVLDKSRERSIISRLTSKCSEEMAVYVKMLYSTLFDLSRSYQQGRMMFQTELTNHIKQAINETEKLFPKKATVACQGVEGAYSQQACDKLFAIPNIMYFNSFEGVFQAIDKGFCRYGILPIENSSNGSVTEVYDLMKKYSFSIVRGIRLKVDHRLLAKPGTQPSDIKEIFSHEQAIGQCSTFLKELKDVKINVCENTAVAARMVRDSGRSDVAAISSQSCAELYGLSVVNSDIQNSDNNYTRFICISKQLEIYPGADRMSLMLNLSHKPGALYEMIAKFAALGLNLTKIESRPIPGTDFEFMFYFELDASIYSDEAIQILYELDSGPDQFNFLGCYNEV